MQVVLDPRNGQERQEGTREENLVEWDYGILCSRENPDYDTNKFKPSHELDAHVSRNEEFDVRRLRNGKHGLGEVIREPPSR